MISLSEYLISWNNYYSSLLYSEDKHPQIRSNLLNKAVEGFSRTIIDFNNDLILIRSCFGRALCYKEMKRLIEMGVDALNSQLFCMDIEEIGVQFRGQITFWGEIDRQHTLPFGSVEDVHKSVRRVRGGLEHERGGVIAWCEWGNDVPRENIEAIYQAWEESR